MQMKCAGKRDVATTPNSMHTLWVCLFLCFYEQCFVQSDQVVVDPSFQVAIIKECIPEGYVPTATDVSTGDLCPEGVSVWRGVYVWSGSLSREGGVPTPLPPVDRQMLLKTLPYLAVGKCIRSIAILENVMFRTNFMLRSVKRQRGR